MKSGRRGIGAELKPTYYRQAVKNVAAALKDFSAEQSLLEFNPEEVPA